MFTQESFPVLFAFNRARYTAPQLQLGPGGNHFCMSFQFVRFTTAEVALMRSGVQVGTDNVNDVRDVKLKKTGDVIIYNYYIFILFSKV